MSSKVELINVYPKSIINTVKSHDLSFEQSLNPYQGCEHGCAYCYARSTHEYWGYSAGIDFERKLLVKQNVIQLLKLKFNHNKYVPKTIMLSGNTDCYQPIERQLKLTKQVLELCLAYQHPVSIITKNALILRDLPILEQLASLNLVNVAISIPTINESLRKVMEPRTSTVANKLKAIEILTDHQIPVLAMIAPIIPGLNSDEILATIKQVTQVGAYDVGYNLVRLNDSVEPVFVDWLRLHFPERESKILNQIRTLHNGHLGERSSVKRNVGQGNIASLIHRLFEIGRAKYVDPKSKPNALRSDLFRTTNQQQLSLF